MYNIAIIDDNLLFERILKMNINLIAIDANKTIGKNPVLVDVAPAYVYENGKRTGEVSGFKYTVALPDKAFEKLMIKIDGECKLEKPDDRHYPVVIFDGLEMRPYWTPEGYKVSATAKNIRAVNAGKA